MTELRPYRAGLGLPQAIIIRSNPGESSRLPEIRHYQDENDDYENILEVNTDFGQVNQNISNAYANRIRTQPYDNSNQIENDGLSKTKIWKEWNINPTLHGPSKLVLPPKFVVSSSNYDELGRSLNDGIDVSVSAAKDSETGKEKESGNSVSDWYSTLASSSSSRSNTPAMDNSLNVEAGPSTQRDHKLATISNITIPETDTRKPLRVHSKDWFIRRALLHSSNSLESSSTRTTSTSIGSLINIQPNSKPKKIEPQYVLGPNNKGYAILKDKLGWNGGGLGKPLGWEEELSLRGESSTSTSNTITKNDVKGKGKQKEDEEGKEEQLPKGIIELDDNGNQIVDLTLSSDDDADDDHSHSDIDDLAMNKEINYGPGRTAPISTQLKLDRKGLGHSFSNSNKSKSKVTHTHREIEMARKRSTHGNDPKKGHGKGLELGKKGKIKWKEWEKNDRDERRAIKAALG
ncbi:uncharacterized protein L201_006664 [Kwoniella dendrophila CBS 6074]|uniref:G-patch domain-containing protein n=1 Tax=Kwoniella dendrophila CBS 6074 TaxID=1295534 RepID=A0AAX4K3H3_9TREE